MNELYGISGKNKALLSTLHGKTQGPFSIKEASEILTMPICKTRLFLEYLSSRRWLSRVQRGLYTSVDLSVSSPEIYKGDPWVVANKIFAPCYIGGWSACEYWHFTDQLFNDIVIFTAKKLRKTTYTLKDAPYTFIVTHIDEKKIFGLSDEILYGVRVHISDPMRTIVDILDNPLFAGGISHASNIVYEYLHSKKRDDKTLIEYIDRLGNKAIYKRLGYIINFLRDDVETDIEELHQTCLKNISKGYSLLAPEMSKIRGKITRKYNLIINAHLTHLAPY